MMNLAEQLDISKIGAVSDVKKIGNVSIANCSLVITELCNKLTKLAVVIVPDFTMANKLQAELNFLMPNMDDNSILHLPDWEMLPYDNFSPHRDIISERLATLYQLPRLNSGVLVLPVSTMMHRLCPKDYILQNCLNFKCKDTIEIDKFSHELISCGYIAVSQVAEHGEFAIRGSIIDIFPIGSNFPYRIDLFDNEIESIRIFNPDNQKSIKKLDNIQILPAHEFPLDEYHIGEFRSNWRQRFSGIANDCPMYQEISKGIASPGAEYYLPLFFQQTATIFDYLPNDCVFIRVHDLDTACKNFYQQALNRFEQYSHDIQRPILDVAEIFMQAQDIYQQMKSASSIILQEDVYPKQSIGKINFAYQALPNLLITNKQEVNLQPIVNFINDFPGSIIFCSESKGRKEYLKGMLHSAGINTIECMNWQQCLQDDNKIKLTIAPIEQGGIYQHLNVAIITENELLGKKIQQRRRRSRANVDWTSDINNLADLQIGSLVVHIEHGVGKYLGLSKIDVSGSDNEFVTLEYAGADKLYVPVANLHLITRYSTHDSSDNNVHYLGSDKWQKTKNKAAKQIKDVAAELLAIYAKRRAVEYKSLAKPDSQYIAFAESFPFEETPDQLQAIEQVVNDLYSDQPMDRVVCGDVGFGKTEVAMRAAFVAAINGEQVAVLVPTTLLAEQHFKNFIDRFADFPVNIDVLSRFKSSSEMQHSLELIKAGKTDIIIGTHKLLQEDIKFKELGLLIIDEEHRFGVRQKEKFKALRAQVNILTLTATPIPRTLNMAMSGIRDLSIISTPPAKRLAVKTFVREYNKNLIQESVERELARGGQVFFLHNDVKTIQKIALELEDLVPTAKISVAHGQMPERQLENVMSEFYHRHYNVLICTTIIETGIDIPSANTIIINRADKFGLAQLHQLRGRVGRSHHQAYAFLLTPPTSLITNDAVKRLEAIGSMETLGSGFTLATHDLEIRGAGELLGEEQSGNINSIGFTLYMELLDKAVKSLKAGKEFDIKLISDELVDVDLQIAAIIPESYCADIQTRLLLYKRISSCHTDGGLDDLKIEFIDRFGIMPESLENLFALSRLRILAAGLGVKKIKGSKSSCKIEFIDKPKIDAAKIIKMIQLEPRVYKLDAQNCLRMSKDLSDPKQRVAAIFDLLTNLSI